LEVVGEVKKTFARSQRDSGTKEQNLQDTGKAETMLARVVVAVFFLWQLNSFAHTSQAVVRGLAMTRNQRAASQQPLDVDVLFFVLFL
jgi:hypothetical protein